MREIGIYIHIPFCKQKCFYCDFVSYSNKQSCIEQYFMALNKEIKNKFKNVKEEIQINTLYIGGGTPSFGDEKNIYNILNLPEIKSNLKQDAEITIEINPGAITKEKLYMYKRAGINRISIGLQSSDNQLLKTIGRIHTYEEFLECYKIARNTRFDNINIDLMLALPGQSIEILEKTLHSIISLNPEHISLYSLILEENTKLFDMVEQKLIELPDEQKERDMYWKSKEILKSNGYNHYEISNFAKKGFESKHNKNCWEQQEYWGFGAAAHSYYNNVRYSNITDVEQYIENINSNLENKNIIINEIQDEDCKEKEFVMLGLRKIQGINIKSFEEKYNKKLLEVFKQEIEELTNKNLLVIENEFLKLSEKGIDFANQVWGKFV